MLIFEFSEVSNLLCSNIIFEYFSIVYLVA